MLKLLPGGKKDEREILAELYVKYGAQVRSRCAWLLKDRAEAEDAMQDVFGRAIGHVEGFRAEASPLTWLLKIATHHCLNLIRAKGALWHDEMEKRARLLPEGHGGSGQHEGRDLVRKLLAKFDEETQRAAVHYYVDEMTLEEVGAAIGRSIPTVRKRLAEFAAGCREELLKQGEIAAPKSEEVHG